MSSTSTCASHLSPTRMPAESGLVPRSPFLVRRVRFTFSLTHEASKSSEHPPLGAAAAKGAMGTWNTSSDGWKPGSGFSVRCPAAALKGSRRHIPLSNHALRLQLEFLFCCATSFPAPQQAELVLQAGDRLHGAKTCGGSAVSAENVEARRCTAAPVCPFGCRRAADRPSVQLCPGLDPLGFLV